MSSIWKVGTNLLLGTESLLVKISKLLLRKRICRFGPEDIRTFKVEIVSAFDIRDSRKGSDTNGIRWQSGKWLFGFPHSGQLSLGGQGFPVDADGRCSEDSSPQCESASRNLRNGPLCDIERVISVMKWSGSLWNSDTCPCGVCCAHGVWALGLSIS